MSSPISAISTIASGQSVGSVVDIGEGTLLNIQMPAVWTAANISFQVSADNVTYTPLYRGAADGTLQEVKLILPLASKAYSLDPVDFVGWRYIKIVSGVDGAGVNQGAARAITVVFNRVIW